MAWVKKRYPNLSAQSAQQTVSEFLEAVSSARQLRRNGQAEARYPWRILRYRDITYTNQDARMYGDFLRLPNGKAGALRVKIPVKLPGRIKEVRLVFGGLLVVCEIEDKPRHGDGTVVGVDLGVNTLIAATDGEKAVLVSGREVKATVQWRNKRLASLQEKQAPKTKRSRRWKRLQRRKHRMLDKAQRRVRDAIHKATRKVADAFPKARVVVGRPFNDAARKIGRKQAQQVSQACNRKIIDQLDYKTCGAIEVAEHYTSQTCPVCGERRRMRREYKCPCGYKAPRDVVGCTNIRRIGLDGYMAPSPEVPVVIQFVRPVNKYPGTSVPGSSGGTPASSSSSRTRSLSL
jgi:putative transposase